MPLTRRIQDVDRLDLRDPQQNGDLNPSRAVLHVLKLRFRAPITQTSQ